MNDDVPALSRRVAQGQENEYIISPELMDRLTITLRQTAYVASRLSRRVANEGKALAASEATGSETIRRMRSAKTPIDDVIQEVVLLALMEYFDPARTGLDAEEDTPTCGSYVGHGAVEATIVIDPIDGTLDYLSGRDNYATCVGVVRAGVVPLFFVAYPERDALYYLDESGRAMMAADFRASGRSRARELETSPPSTTNVVYVNDRVPQAIQDRLTAAGYHLLDDIRDGGGPRECMLACLDGQALAYVAHTRQMRDLLLGAVVGATRGAYAIDWNGSPLAWPGGGRVEGAIFGTGEQPPMAVVECCHSG